MNLDKKIDNFLSRNNLQFISQLFKGIGQIMLQENIIAGVFFTIGVFVASYKMGIALLFATIIATITAKTLNSEKSDIDKGLYGFNAALVGVACLLFFEIGIVAYFAIIVGAIVSTLIQYFFIKNKLSLFTLPFVLTTWALYILIKYLFPETLIISSGQSQLDIFNFWLVPIRGFGQVIFQSSLIAGGLFILGVLVNSYLAMVYGIVAAFLSAGLAYLINIEVQDIYLGLFSFNAVLSAIALSGNKIKDIFSALFAVLIAFTISLIFSKLNLIQLTFPFVAATYFTIFVKNRLIKL